MLNEISQINLFASLIIATLLAILGLLYFLWRRLFYPTVIIYGIQDEEDGPDGVKFGEVTLKIDVHAPPVGSIQLGIFSVKVPNKFLEQNIQVAYVVKTSGPLPLLANDTTEHDLIRGPAILGPNEKCSVLATVRFIRPAKVVKSKRLWYHFLKTKLVMTYLAFGKARALKVRSYKVNHVGAQQDSLPRLMTGGEYSLLSFRANSDRPAIAGLPTCGSLPLANTPDSVQSRYCPSQSHQVPNRGYGVHFESAWRKCHKHFLDHTIPEKYSRLRK